MRAGTKNRGTRWRFDVGPIVNRHVLRPSWRVGDAWYGVDLQSQEELCHFIQKHWPRLPHAPGLVRVADFLDMSETLGSGKSVPLEVKVLAGEELVGCQSDGAARLIPYG